MVKKIKRKLLGFLNPIKVTVFKETGSGIKIYTDFGKRYVDRRDKKNPVEWLELWRTAVRIKHPQPEQIYVSGNKQQLFLYISKNGDYKYSNILISDNLKEQEIDRQLVELDALINSKETKKPEKEKYLEVKAQLFEEKEKSEMLLNTIDEDSRSFMANAMRRNFETYRSDDFWSKYGGFMAIAMTAFGVMLIMFVWLYFGFAPQLEAMRSIANSISHVTIEVINGNAVGQTIPIPPA